MKKIHTVALSIIFLACSSAPAVDLAAHNIGGGLVVVIEPQDAAELASLRKQGEFIVHGLVRDASKLPALRTDLMKSKQLGKVTVGTWDGKQLPFVDGTVNIVISKDAGNAAEIKRILAPYGKALAANGKELFKQPWPKTMDEWTHYRHNPQNNGVSQDLTIGPPRRIKWIGAPDMLRHHDHLPSLNAMTTSKGKLFYIFDESPAASIIYPAQWSLIARDAFNGAILWKKDILDWYDHLWPLKSMPATAPRRLVSVGDDVYVTLGVNAPISHLNALDGSVKKVFAGSERCEEIIVDGDELLALCITGKSPLDGDVEETNDFLDRRTTKFPLARKLATRVKSPLWLHTERRLIVYDIKTGREKVRYDGKVAPLTMATDGKQIYFHDSKSVVALNRATGKKAWTSPAVPIWDEYHGWFGATLVVHDGVVLFAGGENMNWITGGSKGADDTMTALSAVTGKKLWGAPHPPSGYRSPEDLIVAQGLVWIEKTTSGSKGVITGVDIKTGKTVKEFKPEGWNGFHHRCYNGRATEKYIMVSKAGINYVDLKNGNSDNNDWVRGSCGFGFLPANGVTYATPDPCNCYPESKLNGFVALATPEAITRNAKPSYPLVKGPAYAVAASASLSVSPSDWPTYRGNASRSGTTKQKLSAKPRPVWKTAIGGKLSAPVVAGGRIYFSAIERHFVVALNEATGKPVWTYPAGGKVDSPPTVVGDLLYFGAADGTVTCLQAATGRMVWRRRIAPHADMIVNLGYLESVWPAHGSVLYHNGLIYSIAGRNKFVDGGIHLVGLDPKSGAIKASAMDNLDHEETPGMNAEPASTDVLAANSERIFMRSMAYSNDLEPSNYPGRHLFSSNGFLNDGWFHRAFWVYGSSFKGGCGGFGSTGNANYSGRMLLADDDTIYGFGRMKYGWSSAFDYKIYAARKPGLILPSSDVTEPETRRSKKKKKSKKSKKARFKKEPTWSVDAPILMRAMLKAGDSIVAVGPKKIYNELDAIQKLESPEIRKQVGEQMDAWEQPATLIVFDANSGKKQLTMKLTFMPVWDGMAAANGALYFCGQDGAVHCMK